ncbi:grasp-with-spasm system ATP-grasp peptide maturase [Croceiramulus getboli]|nr:grasp-with-spasm system ATP-grasp peptide maturase [Flavobacteriaceae bacterium YJPT1-3]
MTDHLIITADADHSSNEVCNWFYRYGVRFKRLNLDSYKEINSKSDLYSDYFNFDNIDLSIPDEIVSFDIDFKEKYRSIWYRRPNYNIDNMVVEQNLSGISKFLFEKIRLNQKSELKELYEYIFNFSLKGSRVLGNRMKTRVNKLETLSLAVELGISIPRTKVLSCKSKLLEFQSEVNKTLITKSIFEPILASDDLGRSFTSYTNLLTDSVLDKIPDQFFPSLVQEEIEKDFEIRTFVLGDEFYSMAIFSQNNEQTAVDFRRYDLKRPNRTIPFILPNEFTDKIKDLLKIIGLNTCSIDIIKGANGKLYFLEINPVGQFGMVSKPCNYNLEYRIFKYLTNDDE